MTTSNGPEVQADIVHPVVNDDGGADFPAFDFFRAMLEYDASNEANRLKPESILRNVFIAMHCVITGSRHEDGSYGTTPYYDRGVEYEVQWTGLSESTIRRLRRCSTPWLTVTGGDGESDQITPTIPAGAGVSNTNRGTRLIWSTPQGIADQIRTILRSKRNNIERCVLLFALLDGARHARGALTTEMSDVRVARQMGVHRESIRRAHLSLMADGLFDNKGKRKVLRNHQTVVERTFTIPEPSKERVKRSELPAVYLRAPRYRTNREREAMLTAKSQDRRRRAEEHEKEQRDAREKEVDLEQTAEDLELDLERMAREAQDARGRTGRANAIPRTTPSAADALRSSRRQTTTVEQERLSALQQRRRELIERQKAAGTYRPPRILG